MLCEFNVGAFQPPRRRTFPDDSFSLGQRIFAGEGHEISIGYDGVYRDADLYNKFTASGVKDSCSSRRFLSLLFQLQPSS